MNPRSIGIGILLACLFGTPADANVNRAAGRVTICKLIDAALHAFESGLGQSLADYDCVKRNAVEGGRLLVDVMVRDSAGKARRPLKAGQSCGNFQQYTRRNGSDEIFVTVELVRLSGAKYQFEARLGGMSWDAKGRESGTIGIGCGAESAGILVKDGQRWRALGNHTLDEQTQ